MTSGIYHKSASLILAFGLLGCTPEPQSFWYQVNTPVSKLNDDTLGCNLYAAREVPQNTQIATTPTYTTPTNTSCYGYGYGASCTTTGGQTYGGNTYSYDSNAGLRGQLFGSCMTHSGYQNISLPVCDDAATANGRLYRGAWPALTAGACVVANPNGGYDLVLPS